MPDDDGVVVAGGNSATKALAVLASKSFAVATRIFAEGKAGGIPRPLLG
jgi:hypothetical protein